VKNKVWNDALTSLVSYSYLIFLFSYLGTLTLLRLRLLRYFTGFYLSQRRQLLTSSFCLVASILIKIILRFMRLFIPNYDADIAYSIRNNTWYFPLFIFFC
jgi:hypothetical protein